LDTIMQWDPTQYARFAEQRSRPFFDLVSQVHADAPATVADLGCGSGELTAALAERWPGARIVGIDSSPEMIERAQAHGSSAVQFCSGRAEEFSAAGTDVLVSNALLQWVPGHRDLLRNWLAELNPGGWLAFQVPANFSSPSHRLMRAIASSPRWRGRLGTTLRHDDAVAEPAAYLELFSSCTLTGISAWQTTYLHVLPGEDPVLDWVRGSGLRPVLNVLTDDEITEFEAEYGARLRLDYPKRPYGTVFDFRRTFVVAHKAGPARSEV
jgi:trans-aconitate 2-methyltransferase